MKDEKQNLYRLAIAALISEAEYDQFSTKLLLKSPINIKKFAYLDDICKEGNIHLNIEKNHKKGQFTFHSHPVLEQLKQQWFQGGIKTFSNILDPKLINLQSIVMCINLFGTRKLETISIPTTINKEYIKAISYCIEQHLKVPVIPGVTQIKITNVLHCIGSLVSELPTIHSAELINFLTKKEKKKLVEGREQCPIWI